ncbi:MULTISPECIES: TonB-dependent receptor [Pseudomonas]|uniref:Outer membrane heme receptor n=3 Tax=Pseudomonas putida group TaxID=136845 RepID=Q88P47_PSEPK|nr:MULTISPECIES: TonB-dependent receptor [Pseudomonas]AAN66631.2 putative outer membrane heme receptor [Pseudomonas putida KT2440]KMU92767.1 TonB-dependent receptor [Pseudomonas putida]KMY37251.1 TonB-dependent receptor [Pseudomonas putida]MBP2842384.1 TonB-dependent hemoglobin/transferrin/lactoferrin family receptor [Pseudomonas sp. PNP]MCE0861679.1 TonB-dependent hemoglobin/transferrin/lactoferrin family receptor [Pseudomonas alloputida]
MSTGPTRSSNLPRRTGQLSLLTLALLASGACSLPALAAEPAQASSPRMGDYRFSIGQQPLVSAINAFSQVTGWQVGFSAELADGVASPGVQGSLPPDAALKRLLRGTGLSFRKISNGNVVLERQTASNVIALQQVTVSATRSAQDVSQVPSTVSVQTREQLDRQNVNNIQDLVRYEPGVSVSGTGQRSGLNGYNIRGIDGERILTQVDGVSIPDSFFYGPYAQTQRNYVDPEIVKRVEILRGPASVLYGSNAIGGAVSYFTLDPDDIIKPGKDVGARLKTGYSSADESWLTSATVAGRQGDFDGLLHLSQRNGHETETHGSHSGDGLSRTEANPMDARTTNVLAKLGWNYADDARLGFTYERYKDDRDQNILSAVGGPFIPGFGGMNSYRMRQGNDTITRERFGLNHEFDLDSVVADHVKWSFNYQIAKTDQRTDELYVASGRQVFRDRQTTYKDRQWVFDAQLDKAFSIGQTDHLFTYGTTLKQEKVTGSRSGTGTCLNIGGTCTAIGQDSARDGQALVSDFPDPTVNTYSLFAQDEIRWNNWTFMPGARYDYTRMEPKFTEEFLRGLESSGTAPTAQDDSDKKWHRVSPKFGLTYAFNDNYTWYGQYAEGFRTPTAKAMYGRFQNLDQGYRVEGNPNLEPEKSKSYETGLRGNFDAGNFDVAVFYNKYRDFIDEDAVQSANLEQTFQANNIKHATIKGAEFKGRLNLDHFGAPQGLYTQTSIAYTYGRNDDTGQPLNSVNPLKGVFGLGYEQQNYGGLLSWTLVKRKTRVDDSTFYSPDGSTSKFRTPGYGVLDLTGYYKVTDDVTINAGLYNLTDKKYWQWDSVRSYDGQGEAAVTQPANIDRLTMPGRNFGINVVWDI